MKEKVSDGLDSYYVLLDFSYSHVITDRTTVAVVDSHIQRIVLKTEETTVTQQVRHRPMTTMAQLLLFERLGLYVFNVIIIKKW